MDNLNESMSQQSNTTKFIKSTDGVHLFVRDYGSGKPVILIHGWPSSNEMWEYQFETLVQNNFRVIAYDRRGFGRSSQPWHGYDYDTMTDDLKAIIDELKLTDVSLVGFSMGGGEVVRYFSRHGGKNVSKAVLISTVPPFMLKTEDNPDGAPQEMFDGMAKQMREDRIGFLDEFGKTFFGVSLLSKPLSEPLLEHFRNLAAVASPRATLECATAFATTDFRSEMSSVNVPTLIIHGDADKIVPIDISSKKSADMIPNNKFIIYDGAPHGLFYTEREKLNKDLVDFLS